MHQHPSGTELNNYFERPVLLAFHHGFSERFCAASFLLQIFKHMHYSLSLSLFFKFPCSGYIAQRDQNRTGINVSLLKEEREILFWLLLYFSVHCYTSLSLLLMINFIMNCKTLVWHCWPNFWSTILCCIGSRSHEITTSFSRYGLEV